MKKLFATTISTIIQGRARASYKALLLMTLVGLAPFAMADHRIRAVEAAATNFPMEHADMQNPHDARPVIACFGNSLTAGYGVDVDSSYPANLQRDLDAAGYHYRVVNVGISGETTKDGLGRIDRVLALKPALVVLEFGGNDGLRGVPITSSRANLDAMLAKLTSSGTHVALAGITLPPQYTAPYIKQFNETYTLLAKKYSVPLLPFLLLNVYGVPGSIQNDGIHPTAQGCEQVAKNVMGLIRPLLKK